MNHTEGKNARVTDTTAARFPLPVVLFWVSIAVFTFFTALLRGSESILSGLITSMLGDSGPGSLIALFVWSTIVCSFWATIITTVITLFSTMIGKYQMHFAVYQLVGFLVVGLFLLAIFFA